MHHGCWKTSESVNRLSGLTVSIPRIRAAGRKGMEKYDSFSVSKFSLDIVDKKEIQNSHNGWLDILFHGVS